MSQRLCSLTHLKELLYKIRLQTRQENGFLTVWLRHLPKALPVVVMFDVFKALLP